MKKYFTKKIIILLIFIFLLLVPCIPITLYSGDSGHTKYVSVIGAVVVSMSGNMKPQGSPMRMFR